MSASTSRVSTTEKRFLGSDLREAPISERRRFVEEYTTCDTQEEKGQMCERYGIVDVRRLYNLVTFLRNRLPVELAPAFDEVAIEERLFAPRQANAD